LNESVRLFISLLAFAIALVSVLFVYLLLKQQREKGESLTVLAENFYIKIQKPLKIFSILIALVLLLDLLLPTEKIETSGWFHGIFKDQFVYFVPLTGGGVDSCVIDKDRGSIRALKPKDIIIVERSAVLDRCVDIKLKPI
jgi:hypothetical protein